MSAQDPLAAALALPNGARFYRCAFQVNPFDYVKRHAKPSTLTDEVTYNKAIVQACLESQIEVIAITDHYRVSSSEGLRRDATRAGIRVFPGFEAVTKEGVHMLCLFSPDRDAASLERVIGDCGVHDDAALSPTGKYDTLELLEAAHGWGALCVAPHVASKDGLLGKLSGLPRIRAWSSPHLLACSLPGTVGDAPQGMRGILLNENPEHHRDRAVAVLNAQDVQSPDDIAKPGASCWVKMSEVSIEGLRQAFLDPSSRVRLSSDPVPEGHAELVAIAWQGGFLDGAGVHFNENLNVLVGGRGTGKSTVVESLRYVLGLEPIGDDAKRTHEGFVRQVLRSGTKVSLRVRAHRPKVREYQIERTVPNPVVVRDDAGQVVMLSPADVIPRAEVYGQHEISELTKSPEKLTRVIERFARRDAAVARRKRDVQRELQKSRGQILEVRREILQIEERLASLPALEETLRAFQEAGLEDRLKARSLLVREERVLKTASERAAPFQAVLEQLQHALPIDRAFLSERALVELPGKETLRRADEVLARLSADLVAIGDQLAAALRLATEGLAGVQTQWESRRTTVLAAYEKILRELQRSKVDGEEFIRLRHQIEELRPLRERETIVRRDLKEHEARRLSLLVEWEDSKASEFRELKRAADRVNKQLANRVRVNVTFAGNREPLLALLKGEIGGRLSEALQTLKEKPELSLAELASASRAGKEFLAQRFALSPAQAERIAQAPPEVIMQLEELDLASTTGIDLNVAGDDQTPSWQALDSLSTGQKATAVLLLLLLESDAPLVVDQPEDDLDNRFITDGIVPKMRDEKRRRQFVFATHNANVPVLGDAELIVGFTASGEADRGKGRVSPEYMASIDAKPVRELVEEILEGGKKAFEMRRLKYGF